MAKGQLQPVLNHLRNLVAAEQGCALPDEQLLGRFVADRDEAAFAAFFHRHGAMVLGVCRRLLRDPHDAEDACQATFLVLARKAASVRKRQALGSWLHGVACRVAGRLRADLARRRHREGRVVAYTGEQGLAG